MKKTILVLFMVSQIVGCAKSGGSSESSAAASKSMWSSWTRTDNALTVNLTGGALGVPLAFNVTFANGAGCACTLNMTGTEASGNWTISSCSYTSGGTGNPGCSSLNSSGTFSKSSTQLQLCDPTCGTYN